MSKEGKTGVSADTPKNVLFGAGTIHKGLAYTAGTGWNFSTTCIGATNGGSKLTITPEYYDVPVDGKNIPVKGLKRKIGESATLDVNFVELTEDVIKTLAVATSEESADDDKMNLITSKPDVDDSDYWDNIAFVGKTLDGRTVIAILENALCTSGLPLEGKTREGATIAATFTCHADIEDNDDLETLPWKIYYPKTVV